MRLISDLKNDHFEPLNFIQYTTLNSLKRWSEFNRSALIAPPPPSPPPVVVPVQPPTPQTTSSSPYPHREDINGRFILWEGDISLLHVDCIANTTNERLNENNSVSSRIANRAGSSLLDELKAIKSCRPGEVLATRGHSLPARYIIHTVCPTYSCKNRTAAIWSSNVLQNCYK